VPEPVFTIGRVRSPGAGGLPERYQTSAVLRDGVRIGELKFDAGRWKSAGGPAWRGALFPACRSTDVIKADHAHPRARCGPPPSSIGGFGPGVPGLDALAG